MSYSIGGSPGISVKQLRVTLAFLALACTAIALTQFEKEAQVATTASMVEASSSLNCKWITVNGTLCKVHDGGPYNNLKKCHTAGASGHTPCQ